MIRRLIYMCAFLFAALGFYGCQAEDGGNSSPQGEDGEVFFSLNIPPVSADITRALSVADEQTINTIDILAFDASSDKFTYHVTGTVVSGAGTATQGIKAKVQRGDGQRFVFLINASSVLTIPTKGDDRETVLAGITFSLTPGVGWKAYGTYDPLPMWGTVDINIPSGGLASGPTVNLYRSVSRIQVINSAGNFTLSKVHLYRANLSGRVAPIDGKTNGISLPVGGVTANDDDHPISYSVSGNALERSIYTFERENKGKDKDEVACLVLEGTYASKTYFYRIDFFKSGNYLDFIRNYSYTLTIANVKGIGYDSKEEALNGETMMVDANVQEWNPDDLTNVTIGQYYLGINKNYFEFEYPAVTAATDGSQLVIKTNYPEGWTIDTSHFPADHWLKLDKDEGDANATTGEVVQLTMDANAGEERTESFVVKAGVISLPVTVKQGITSVIKPTGITITSIDSQYDAGTKVLSLSGSGTTGTLIATISPGNSTIKTVSWEIDDPSTTKIDGSATATSNSGDEVTFTAVGCGETEVKAYVTLTDGSKLEETVTVKVNIEATSITNTSDYEYMFPYNTVGIYVNDKIRPPKFYPEGSCTQKWVSLSVEVEPNTYGVTVTNTFNKGPYDFICNIPYNAPRGVKFLFKVTAYTEKGLSLTYNLRYGIAEE